MVIAAADGVEHLTLFPALLRADLHPVTLETREALRLETILFSLQSSFGSLGASSVRLAVALLHGLPPSQGSLLGLPHLPAAFLSQSGGWRAAGRSRVVNAGRKEQRGSVRRPRLLIN